MTERYDGSTIDLEQALVRYMVEQRLTRRDLLERIARVGAAAALAPVIAACTTGGGASPSPSASAAATRGAGRRPARRPRRRPTPVPEPEAELFVYNWTDYIGENDDPVVRGEVRRQGHVRLLREHRRGVRQARRRRRRLRRLVPDLGRHPGVRGQGRAAAAGQVAAPEHRQPRHGVVGPGLRPGQHALRAVHVVDDRRRLRHDEGHGQPDQQQGALGPALREAHLDARRLPGSVRHGADPARPLGEHDRHGPDGRGPRAAPAAEAAGPRVQHRHDRDDELGRRVDRPDLGRRHVRHPGRERERRLLPPRGRRRPGLGHAWRSSRARSTRSRPTCSSTTCSTPR